MKIVDKFNNFFYKKSNKYLNNSQAVIIACYFNPQRNEYRKKAFDIWYQSVKHLNVQIIEATLSDIDYELPKSITKKRVILKEWLWHKEYLLNLLIKDLPDKYKYVFWLDTDIIFDNTNWLVDSCNKLKSFDVIQPFNYCIHLDKDDFTGKNTKLSLEEYELKYNLSKPIPNRKIWKSYASNFNKWENDSQIYEIRGHVGFAWGATLSFLKKVGGLFQNAKIGGADGIMAYSCNSPIVHESIVKMFGNNSEIEEYTENWFLTLGGRKLTFTSGTLKHIWHGDINKRQYYQRITNYYKKPVEKRTEYFRTYMEDREFIEKTSDYKYDYFKSPSKLINDSTNIILSDSNSTNVDSNINLNNFEGFGNGNFDGGGAEGNWDSFS